MPDTNYETASFDNIQPLVKCLRCGALVNNGGLSREKHDNFHEALASLFENVNNINDERNERLQ